MQMSEKPKSLMDTDVLENVFEIEELLSDLAKANDHIQFLQDLKKFRAEAVNIKIEEYTITTEKLRKIIQNTLAHFDEKTLEFPGVGKVGRRTTKGRWQVQDTDAVVEYFDKKGLKKEIVQTKESVDRRKLSKLIENYQAQGEKIPGVVLGKDKESLSVTFEKTGVVPKGYAKAEEEKPQQPQPAEELSSLEL